MSWSANIDRWGASEWLVTLGWVVLILTFLIWFPASEAQKQNMAAQLTNGDNTNKHDDADFYQARLGGLYTPQQITGGIATAEDLREWLETKLHSAKGKLTDLSATESVPQTTSLAIFSGEILLQNRDYQEVLSLIEELRSYPAGWWHPTKISLAPMAADNPKLRARIYFRVIAAQAPVSEEHR